MDLFADLPDPVNVSPADVSPNLDGGDVQLHAIVDGSTRGVKRKLEDADDEEQSGLVSESDVVDGRTLATSRSPPRHSVVVVDVVARHLRGFISELQGERDEMQDANVVLDDFCPLTANLHPSMKVSFKRRISLYGVFDGHAGSRASRYLAANLPTNVSLKFPKGDSSQIERHIGKCLTDAFKKTDEDFLKEATKRKPTWKDGSTAIVLLAVNDTLYIANLGDSKAVLCRYNEDQDKCVPIALSREHGPTQYEERMRIQKAGGHIRDGRVMGVLEVSRSIGDGQYKTCGVIATPDVKRCQLTKNDRFVIMACDGLWKTFTSEEAVQYVGTFLKDHVPKNSDAIDHRCSLSVGNDDNLRYGAACLRLAKEAVRRGCGDNVTVLIVAISSHN